MLGLKNLEKVLPAIRRYKCKEAEMGNSYLVEDLTIRRVASHFGIGCVADPEEASMMSKLMGLPVVAHSVWVRSLDKLEVGKIYEGHLQSNHHYELPQLKLQN
ncbi:hypothetical protein [Argonema galeatum]|uniref:hypothetical protein n=1 Tax=Argonema galeatum TaxID=2942762 RepID=UPI0020139148|nr:hypothetical protein [Argonema galeatum]MCL1468084.1 hypothetical protein [Argonema galeatum A003/A1]